VSTISLRLPDSLHQRVRELAKQDNISINQFIATALSEKMAALMTVDYLEERAKQGKENRFRKALSKVRDVEPETVDRP